MIHRDPVDLPPLRVGYVVKRYPRYSETFIVNEILAHQAAGLEIEIFALNAPCDAHFQDRIAKVRAPVHYLPNKQPKIAAFWEIIHRAGRQLPAFWPELEAAFVDEARDVFQAAHLALIVQAKRVSHLHAHFATSATNVARLAARFSAVPYTLTAHAKDIFHQDVQPQDLRRKLQDAAMVVTVSDFNAQHLQADHGLEASLVERIYNGLDLDEFSFCAPQHRPAKIVAVGRLVEKKGFGDLIQACRILADRGLQFECQIIGDGELEAQLRQSVTRLDLVDRVHLLGARPQSEIIDLMRGAAVLVAPCIVGQDGNRDGLPTVLAEAMALGTPCVATDVTGIPEILQHELTGLMVPQHDPAAIALAVERLLGDPSLQLRLARNARTQIEAKFDVHENAARLREIFRRAQVQQRPKKSDALQEVV